MKTIGLIGGMSWESSLEYYRMINQLIKEKKGGLHSAECLMYSVDFEQIERYQREGNWEKAGDFLGEVALKLERGGADFLVLCTNTMHKVAKDIEQASQLPLLHIADATREEIVSKGIKTIGLLGTKYTMEQDFYKRRLEDKGLRVVIPEESDRDIVNQVIFEELCLGNVNATSRDQYHKIMDDLVRQGAEGIILGCTEIGMLIKQSDVDVPLFDTALIHAKKAVEMALGQD